MVGRAHDHERGPERIADREDLGEPGAAVAPQHHPAPQRPADVQARHRRVLVGHPAHAARCTRLGAPPAVRAVVRHGVHEPVTGGEQPGRAGGQQREADQADERGRHQPGAGPPVVLGAGPEQPDQERGRDHVVQRGVPEVRRHSEPGLAREQPVERVLRVEVQGLLEAQDRQAVVDGGGDVTAGEEPAGRVAAVDQEDQGQLGPPAQPGSRGHLGARCLGLRHPIALPLLRAARPGGRPCHFTVSVSRP